jgi:hypothetical protein
VTTSTPLPNVNGTKNRARVERFIYDGVRRVQEYVTESGTTPTAQPTSRLERQYIWGPGDGVAGVDELLCQMDATGRPWWVIQDGGGDIAALASCADSGPSPARIVAQWQYDFYGTVVSADHFAPHPRSP